MACNKPYTSVDARFQSQTLSKIHANIYRHALCSSKNRAGLKLIQRTTNNVMFLKSGVKCTTNWVAKITENLLSPFLES